MAELLPAPTTVELTEVEKFRLINSCHTFAELQAALPQLGTIPGSRFGHEYPPELNAIRLKDYQAGKCGPNALTRTFGLRQQAMYLRYYEGIPE